MGTRSTFASGTCHLKPANTLLQTKIFISRLSNTDNTPATGFSFGEEVRPIKLEKIVIGYPKRPCNGEFLFEAGLNQYLPGLIEKYSEKKSCLVFCSTRKSTARTAEFLADKLTKLGNPVVDSNPEDPVLAKCMAKGIAFHHAGLSAEDRALVENLFKAGKVKIVCSTSTLAVGLNLPARLVIVKSTMQYLGGKTGFKEYDDADVLQMIGRAGRLGLDTKGVAVIMTDLESKRRYEAICHANKSIDSNFHNLEKFMENLTSEIVLGNVFDTDTALSYLQSSFFHVRALKTPQKYGLASKANVNEFEMKLIADAVSRLREYEIIDSTFSVTIEAKVMARYHLKAESVSRLKTNCMESKTGKLLMAVSELNEYPEHRVIGLNKATIDKIRKSAYTRYSGGNDVFALLQFRLGEHDDVSLKPAIYEYCDSLGEVTCTLLRALTDLAIAKGQFPVARASIELVSQLKRKTWNDTPQVLTQIPGIGKANARALYRAGIKSIFAVLEAGPERLQVLLRRHSPFGAQLIESIKQGFPMVTRLELVDQRVRVEVSSGSMFQGHAFVVKQDDTFNHQSFRGTISHLEFPVQIGQETVCILFESHCGVDRTILVEDLELNDATKNHQIKEKIAVIHQTTDTLGKQTTPVGRNVEREQIPLTPVSIKENTIKRPAECLHKCRDKDSCAHDCCKRKRPRTNQSKIDYIEWLASLSNKGPCSVQRTPLMPSVATTPEPDIKIVQVIPVNTAGAKTCSKAEMNTLKKDSQDSLHTILENLGY